jgi:hypothetical protein
LRAHLKVLSLNDLEVTRRIKRELFRKRREIEAMKDEKNKKKAMKIYAELLMTMELGDAS